MCHIFQDFLPFGSAATASRHRRRRRRPFCTDVPRERERGKQVFHRIAYGVRGGVSAIKKKEKWKRRWKKIPCAAHHHSTPSQEMNTHTHTDGAPQTPNRGNTLGHFLFFVVVVPPPPLTPQTPSTRTTVHLTIGAVHIPPAATASRKYNIYIHTHIVRYTSSLSSLPLPPPPPQTSSSANDDPKTTTTTI